MCSGVNSSSAETSSSSSTSTNTEDNKVSATDNALALGKDSSFSYSNDFSENVKEAFEELVQLSRDTGIAAMGFAQQAIQSNEKNVETMAARATTAEETATLKDQIIFKQLIPYIGVALLLWVFSFGNTKGGKRK